MDTGEDTALPGSTPVPTLTRAQAREVDRRAGAELGIPGIVLMENAGAGAARLVLDERRGDGPVAILCGGGNNGGDGYVVARHLAGRGVPVTILATTAGRDLPPDAAKNREIVERMGLPIGELEPGAALASRLAAASVVVDALLGTGFRGAVRAPLVALIRALVATHGAGVPVVALDVPSGLDADTGAPSNATVRADLTVTFAARKRGFESPGAAAWTGRVVVVGIGVPDALVARVAASPEGFQEDPDR